MHEGKTRREIYDTTSFCQILEYSSAVLLGKLLRLVVAFLLPRTACNTLRNGLVDIG